MGTLPVVALGVGIWVDYGIYIYSRFLSLWRPGRTVHDTYQQALDITGNAVLFTGVTLATGVATWILSPLKFQADMGLLLTFMFLFNMRRDRGDAAPQCIVYWGHNPVNSGPDGETRFNALDSLAGNPKIIVVDPRRTRLAKRADVWLQLRPGPTTRSRWRC